MEALSQVSTPLYLFPAYGKSYKTKEEAVQDWMAGVDFRIHGGSYCSVRDATNLRLSCSTLWIYWNRVDCVRIM